MLKTRLGVDSGRVWRSLGRHLAAFCLLLGGSWPLFGASGSSLGHFLDALGWVLAALWSFSTAFWPPGPSQALILKGLGTSPIEFWRAFHNSFDVLFATPRISHIMLLKMLCPRFDIYFGFSFLPCSAAVRAQHMELEPSWLFGRQNF